MNKLTNDDSKVYVEDKCTTIAVGRKATIDGSVMATHTDDCAECDWRINKVPARDWPEGSQRPIYIITGAYPRQVREDRGYTWSKANLENLPPRKEWENYQVEILGYIPQVPHTYAIIEGSYGIMNEHQVAIGESTCAAKLYAAPVGSAGGKALLEASELSQIALERAKTAREAIQIMGDLAVKYGFYSADWDTSRFGPSHAMGEGGEALSVTDTQEAWIFHIIPDDTGASAVWVAQRIPDNHISVVANQFVIRDIDPYSDHFMMSDNVFTVAERLGWWSPRDGKPLNFLKTFAPERYHPNYANMRVWRVFSLANPNLNLPMKTNPFADDYPFSVEVPRTNLLSAEDIMNMNRDHFQGTSFSTHVGLAAGPYGDPNRFDPWSWGNMTVWDTLEGEFPSFVAVSRSNRPSELSLLWFSLHAPDTAPYTPIYVNSETLPPSWIRGTMHKYDPTTAWWNFCAVDNYASRFYVFAIKSIREAQRVTFTSAMNAVKALEEKILSGQIPSDAIVPELTQLTLQQGEGITSTWNELFTTVLTTYRDGYVMKDFDKATIGFDRMFYPKWWLDQVGYFDIGGNKNGILFQPSPIPSASTGLSYGTASILILMVALISFIFGLKKGKTDSKPSGHKYAPIIEMPSKMTSSENIQPYQDLQNISRYDERVTNKSHNSQDQLWHYHRQGQA